MGKARPGGQKGENDLRLGKKKLAVNQNITPYGADRTGRLITKKIRRGEGRVLSSWCGKRSSSTLGKRGV